MLQKHIQTLNQVRAGSLPLSQFLYSEGKTPEGYNCDKNEKARYQLLLALQYDRRDSDEALLRELFKAEIEMHRKETFQGLFESLQLNAFLLARFRRMEDIPLFIQAKEANFDTFCGFDREYLLAAGDENAFDFAQTADAEVAERFYHLIAETIEEAREGYSPAHMKEWWAHRQEYFEDTFAPQSLTEEIDMAIELEEREIMLAKIAEWENTVENWDESALGELKYYKQVSGDLEGQIRASEALLEYKETDWDRTSHLQEIAKLYLKANRPHAAWANLQAAHPHLYRVEGWKDVGLGRFILEATFDIVLQLQAPKDKAANEAYTWGKQHIPEMGNLHLNLLEKAAQAGRMMRDPAFAEIYQRRWEQECRKLDELLGK